MPNENYNAHWNNIIGAIENYCTNSYPWMGYLDVQDRPNTIAIYVATNYINLDCNNLARVANHHSSLILPLATHQEIN